MIKDSNKNYGYEGVGNSSSVPTNPETTGQNSPQFTCCICNKRFAKESTKVFPFCSTRCQQIDLGRWYNEEYALPLDGQEEQEFDSEEES
ncbi:MAG: DNA gyrase inhibitor YacG [Planctomycetota bacterium]